MIYFKILFFLIIIYSFKNYFEIKKINNLNINKEYTKIIFNLNISFQKEIIKKIKIGIFTYYLKNGGRGRITSLILNYFQKVQIFDLYLFINRNKEDFEYKIPINIKKVIIKDYIIKKLIKQILKKKIDILIYQLSNAYEINILNQINKTKTIFFQHQSLFYWLYSNYTYFKVLYKSYLSSKFIISLIHMENDYLFKKWGLKSMFMNNFITYEYNLIIPSYLSSKNIVMVGRADNKFKRFDIGIQSMEYIIEQIPDCKMGIISNTSNIYYLVNIIKNLNLENNILFYGFSITPDLYFNNISLHIIPSISESFCLSLAETKIYGIPNILIGLNYISISKGGIIIIYDDRPEYIAKESIKILLNTILKTELGKKARYSMKQFDNYKILNKWIKLILSIYYGDELYTYLKDIEIKISIKESLNILEKQIELLNMRKSQLFELNNMLNISFFEN